MGTSTSRTFLGRLSFFHTYTGRYGVCMSVFACDKGRNSVIKATSSKSGLMDKHSNQTRREHAETWSSEIHGAVKFDKLITYSSNSTEGQKTRL